MAFRTHADEVRLVGGNIPAHQPRCTVGCGMGVPRRGAHQPLAAHEVARFYLAPNPADDSAALNTPSAASNAPVCDGCIAAGLVGIADAMRSCSHDSEQAASSSPEAAVLG